MAHETKYGTQPFETVTRAEFSLTGLNTLRQAAYLQYKVTLLKPVIRAEISYAKKSLVVDYTGQENMLRLIEETVKPVKAIPRSRAQISYDEIIARGFHE